MQPAHSSTQANTAAADDDEDPYDARIRRSGCQREHEALQDCHFEKKDWRACMGEMKAFRACWQRTHPAADETTKSSS
ncbi:hypothetical protein H9P43_003108 [Blastocladiella emersonii ATCC 22665]|nr:hypothetical protein H9P43_003108 [Blastocladiella emersonii ATCC 22665]